MREGEIASIAPRCPALSCAHATTPNALPCPKKNTPWYVSNHQGHAACFGLCESVQLPCLLLLCCVGQAKRSLSRCDHFQANLLSQQRLQALLGSRQIDARITSSTVYETRSAPPLQLLMTMIGKSFVGDVKFRQPASQRTANGKRQAISCALLH